jgi:hypothetical protein
MSKKKMGRPPLPKKEFRGEVFGVRLRPDEAREVQTAIRESKQTKPDWLRDALLSAARKK